MNFRLIRFRRGTAAEWAAADPVLDEGEPGWDTTNEELRIGNGVDEWALLDPIGTGGSSAAADITIVDAADDFTATNVEDALAELQADAEAHAAAGDPHPGYLTAAEGDALFLTEAEADALYDALGAAAAALAAAEAYADGAVSDHEAAANPHPTYLTEAEGDAAYADITEPIAAAHIVDATEPHDHGQMAGLNDDDHPQYATHTEFDDHSARHENGGADEISLTGLDGTPAALTTHEADTSTHGVAEVAGIADITFETLDAAGDVGTSANTLAEGDHTHAGGGLDAETAGMFGDGSDGAITLDAGGSTPHAVIGATRSGTTWTLVRDIFCTNLTIDATVVVEGLYRIYCTGTLDNNGTIRHNGSDGSGSNGGNAAVVGGVGGGAGGGNGVASSSSPASGNPGTSISIGSGFVAGGTGGMGGTSSGGAGGTNSGTITRHQVPRDLFTAQMQLLRQLPATHASAPTAIAITGGTGGGGGGRTEGGTGNTVGGGGGGGAGVVFIAADVLDNSGGVIQAIGGNGANATGAGLDPCGGGGGGGGGAIYLFYRTFTSGTESVDGGSIGTNQNGGAAAVQGNPGNIYEFDLG